MSYLIMKKIMMSLAQSSSHPHYSHRTECETETPEEKGQSHCYRRDAAIILITFVLVAACVVAVSIADGAGATGLVILFLIGATAIATLGILSAQQ